MGIILRQSLFNTIYSYAGAVIGFVNVIWLYPFILEAEQFGLTRVMISIGLVGAQVASLGMGNVTLRFFPRFRDHAKKHFGFFFWATCIPLIGFLLFSLAGWIFQDPVISFYSDESALFGEYYVLIFPLLFFLIYFNILESYIRSLFDTILVTFLNEVFLRLCNTVIILIYFMGWIPFGQFMWLFVLCYGFQVLIILGYIAWKKELSVIPDMSVINRGLVKKMGDYAFFALLGGVTTMTFGSIDMLMVGGLTSMADTAIYAVSFYLASMIKIPSRSLAKISFPVIAEAQHKNDLDTIASVYSKSSINQILVGGLIFIGVWVNVDNVYRFLPDGYQAGMYVFFFIGLAKLIDMATGFSTIVIRTSKWYRFDLYATMLLVGLTVITNLIFIPLFGISGAALATAISVLIQKSIFFFYVLHRFGIHPFTSKTPLALLLLLLAWASAAIVPEVGFWPADLLIRSMLVTAIILTGILKLHLSVDLENTIKQLYSRIFH